MKYSKYKKAVSLVELSIVILIISLITAMVTTSFVLKNSAELKAIMADFSNYKAGFEGFYFQYEDYPGDISDATTKWPETDDGDGNSQIEYPGESLPAWQHLSLAGYIEKSYTGIPTDGANEASPGINVPATKRIKLGYNLVSNTINAELLPVIELGAFQAGGEPSFSALLPREAKALDAKFDDGLPLTGLFIGLTGEEIVTPAFECVNEVEDYSTAGEAPTCIVDYIVVK